jgi:anti-anti-sigma factor
MPSRSPATTLNVVFEDDRPVIRVADVHFADTGPGWPGQALPALIDDLGRSDVALDFENVLFLSSIGLAILLTINKQLQAEGGRLTLVNVHPHVQEIFAVTRLTTVLEILPRD